MTGVARKMISMNLNTEADRRGQPASEGRRGIENELGGRDALT
jgi:hypothetical protein